MFCTELVCSWFILLFGLAGYFIFCAYKLAGKLLELVEFAEFDKNQLNLFLLLTEHKLFCNYIIARLFAEIFSDLAESRVQAGLGMLRG